MRLQADSALLAFGLATTACSAIGNNFKQPEIRLDHAVVRGVGLTGGSLDLIVKVENPNNFSLQGTKLQVGFDVEGSHLGDVEYDDNYSITQAGTTTLTLPLRFGWSGVGSAVRAALSYGDLPYKMKGQATLSTPWGQQVVPFTHEGRAPLTRPGTSAIPGTSQ